MPINIVCKCRLVHSRETAAGENSTGSRRSQSVTIMYLWLEGEVLGSTCPLQHKPQRDASCHHRGKRLMCQE